MTPNAQLDQAAWNSAQEIERQTNDRHTQHNTGQRESVSDEQAL